MTDTVKKTTQPEDLPPPSEVKRGMGWRPEIADVRDRVFMAPRAELRQVVEPLGANVRIHDQGMLGSCTGQAATSMLEIYFRQLGLDIRTGQPLTSNPLADSRPGASDAEQHSRLMAYYIGREYINETGVDYGAYNRDVVKGLVNYGVAPESSWPYNVRKFASKPTATAYKKAGVLRERIRELGLVYERVLTLGSLLAAVNANQPVLIGFTVYNSIFGVNAQNDVLPMPRAGEPPIGGHAVVVDGYSMPDRMVDVVNSWGTSWGKRGRYRMGFDWFAAGAGLVDDMWTLRKP